MKAISSLLSWDSQCSFCDDIALFKVFLGKEISDDSLNICQLICKKRTEQKFGLSEWSKSLYLARNATQHLSFYHLNSLPFSPFLCHLAPMQWDSSPPKSSHLVQTTEVEDRARSCSCQSSSPSRRWRLVTGKTVVTFHVSDMHIWKDVFFQVQ